MADSSKSRGLSESVCRELEIASATAREQILNVHVRYALEFIEHARPRVSPPRSLGIYARLHDLSEADAEIITQRAYVKLGQRMIEQKTSGEVAADTDGAEASWEPQSLLRRIRMRLRGRVNQGLRRWVELHTGRAEVALLEVHVANALRFIEILRPEASFAFAVSEYTEATGVRKSWAEIIYYFALDRLGGSPADPFDRRAPEAQTPAEPADDERPLRIVENRR